MNRETKKKIKTAGAVLFVLYILALIYFLFFADRYGQMAFAQREYHYNLVLFTEIRRFWNYREQLGFLAVAANLLGNVVGFMPFGMILPLICRNARGFFFITFSGFTLSLCVEVTQLMTKLGSFDVDDLLMNTLGAAAGYLIFAVCHGIYDKKRGRK
ncbi:MAG TPA: VanZ family protein [Candidatus Blautia avicola]|uniref:VanZ family protein n=2 Tax=Blautia TaxID=572511 RepID=A0A9D2QUG4_9FIRM|nr:VanZ family protein [Candidatus Blautia stercorigallinarum]HJD28640.1 VanZ family protein [Candidatus Blautia avicola]